MSNIEVAFRIQHPTDQNGLFRTSYWEDKVTYEDDIIQDIKYSHATMPTPWLDGNIEKLFNPNLHKCAYLNIKDLIVKYNKVTWLHYLINAYGFEIIIILGSYPNIIKGEKQCIFDEEKVTTFNITDLVLKEGKELIKYPHSFWVNKFVNQK